MHSPAKGSLTGDVPIFGNLLVNKEVPMNKKYIVRLTDEERTVLDDHQERSRQIREKLRRATILLKADVNGPSWNDSKISESVGCRTRTVENVRQTFVLEALRALVRKSRQHRRRRNARRGWQAKRCSAAGKPPAGYGRGRCGYWPIKWWNWRSWNRSVRRRSVRRLKKWHDQWKIEYWVIPPNADGEYVACMEEVLETYENPTI